MFFGWNLQNGQFLWNWMPYSSQYKLQILHLYGCGTVLRSVGIKKGERDGNVSLSDGKKEETRGKAIQWCVVCKDRGFLFKVTPLCSGPFGSSSSPRAKTSSHILSPSSLALLSLLEPLRWTWTQADSNTQTSPGTGIPPLIP